MCFFAVLTHAESHYFSSVTIIIVIIIIKAKYSLSLHSHYLWIAEEKFCDSLFFKP